ncbi:MAG: glycoside hydrolase family 31 protein [Cytophagales bacterium]|nr:glycoside hydrolase family 31 protein [Cytophagales bacterium]
MNRIKRGCMLLLIFLPAVLSAQIHAGNYHSHQMKRNKLTIFTDKALRVEFTLLSQNMFKLLYLADGKKEKESFAVLPDAFSDAPDIHVSETPQNLEIFTNDLIIRIAKNPLQVRVYDKWQKLLMEDVGERGYEANGNKILSAKTLKPGERVYGLGEKNGSLNRVGGRFRMWNSDKPCYQVTEDPLYKSIPFFISSLGYGIFFDNTYKTSFDFGVNSSREYSFGSEGGNLRYYFIFGPGLKQVIKRYASLTGNPIMPPAWGLGFAQCRGLLTNEKLTRDIAEGYRKRKIPCDIIYQDIGWTQHLQDFEWRKENYDNPQKMLSDLNDQGFKVIVSQDPVISQANEKQWAEADSLEYFVKDSRTGRTYDMPWPWGGNCGVVDFTNEEVADWWGKYQQKAIDDGVQGFWTDMGEPAWSNEDEADRLNMRHVLGPHKEIHNVYGLTWDKTVTEQFEKRNPNKRIFQMTRAGYAGMQRYTFGWSGDSGNGGDVAAGWEQLNEQLSVAMSAGMGLIPFWSCDISGYCGDIKDYEAFSELYTRWVQFGAFNPLSRIHHEGNNAVEPWLFGEETEKLVKQAIELKYSLFPYIYTYSRKAYDTGLPLIRAMVLEYPSDKQAFELNSQFMFGEEMLVAPVTEEEAYEKRVYLPKGEWVDFHHPEKAYKGKQWISCPVELDDIPVFVKRGSIIPQMPVMQFIDENPNYPLVLNVFPHFRKRKAVFHVYEDDGTTNDYKKNIYGERIVSCRTSEKSLEIRIKKKEHNEYSLKSRAYVFRLHLNEKPAGVYYKNKKMKKKSFCWKDNIPEKDCWHWDKESNECVVKLEDCNSSDALEIRFR